MNNFSYEVTTGSAGNTIIVRTDEDGRVWFIPTDPANSDYQSYLIWQAAQPKAGK